MEVTGGFVSRRVSVLMHLHGVLFRLVSFISDDR
jgi:hypothetical protein